MRLEQLALSALESDPPQRRHRACRCARERTLDRDELTPRITSLGQPIGEGMRGIGSESGFVLPQAPGATIRRHTTSRNASAIVWIGLPGFPPGRASTVPFGGGALRQGAAASAEASAARPNFVIS